MPSPRPHSRWAPVGKSDIERNSNGVVGQSTMSAGPKKGAGQPTTHQHPSEFNLLWLYRHGYRTSPFRFSSNRLLISATSARGRWLGGGAEASERRHTLGQPAKGMRSVSQLSMSSVFMSWFLVEVIYNPGDSLKNTFNSPSFARPHDGKPASRVSDDRERVTSGVGARARRGQHSGVGPLAAR